MNNRVLPGVIPRHPVEDGRELFTELEIGYGRLAAVMTLERVEEWVQLIPGDVGHDTVIRYLGGIGGPEKLAMAFISAPSNAAWS